MGNGKLTGSVHKETIAVSDRIRTSVQNRRSRIHLPLLSCSRVREMRRDPEVPEERVPVVECLDCRARISSKELAPIHSVKSGILRNVCSTSQKEDADLGKSALTHTARLNNSLAISLKRMVTELLWLFWRIHDNWVSYFRLWSRRSLHRFYGRALPYRNRFNLFDSPKPKCILPTFGTPNCRLE